MISNSHIENISGAVFYSDSSWNGIDRLFMSDTLLLVPATPMFGLNAGTAVSRWQLNNNQFYVSTFNITPTAQIDALAMTGNYIYGTMSVTAGGTGGATATLSANSHGGSATFAGAWGALEVYGSIFLSGSLINTATGGVNINATDASRFTSGTMAVARGGTGVTTKTGTGSVVLSESPTFTGTLSAATGVFSATVSTGGYTVAALPVAPGTGARAYVTDQLATCAATGAALTGGGALTCPVFYNGAAWVGG
jgi:hypothetical protein